MSQLPLIAPTLRVSDHTGLKSARTPRSVDHMRRSYASSITSVTYAERFHYITKTVNYDELSDQAIWREYEKLRECLKTLNEEILAELEKKAMVTKKNEQPKTKSQQEQLRQLEEEAKVYENKIKTKKQQLSSTEFRVKFLTKQGIREQLQIQCEEITAAIAKQKVQNKDMRRKTKMLARDLVTAPQQLLDKLLQLEQQMVMADRKAYKLRRRSVESDKLIEESIQRFNELTKAIQSRQEQYKVAEKYVEEQINVQNYEQIKAKRDQLLKYESPLKRNYLIKLKELDLIVSNVSHHDKVVTETQQSIIAIRAETESIAAILNAKKPTVSQQKNYEKPIMKHRHNGEKRHASMMEIRDVDDKNNTSGPTESTDAPTVA